MSIKHGIGITETDTQLTVPKESTAGLQVVFGTAPVNLATDPYKVTNEIITAYSFKEAALKLGYSSDFKNYTLCQSMDATFKIKNVAPIIFVNVLDPEKHVKDNASETINVANGKAIIKKTGILLDTLTVKDAAGTETFTVNEDYVASFDNDGYVVIALVDGGSAEAKTKLTVTSKSIDPSAVTKTDIIGGVDVKTQKETGLELIRKIYPKLSMNAGLISAPGWTEDATVATVLQAKCENINGCFSAMCLIDVDTTKAKTYDSVKEQKEKQGIVSKYAIACWPQIVVGEVQYAYSAILSAVIAYTDAANGDVPSLSPSNKAAGITGTVLADGTVVDLDQEQGNIINSFGVVTAINNNGWKTWGNYTAAYPTSEDVKDIWICVRRMIVWWGNSFILTFSSKVDDLANYRLIKNICDTESIRGNALTAQGHMAGLTIEFREDDNPVTSIMAGNIKFKTMYAFYTPAQHITDDLEFDPTILQNALFGGE